MLEDNEHGKNDENSLPERTQKLTRKNNSQKCNSKRE